MPPDRGRAPKACAACRKSKQKCYDPTSGRGCLRCERGGLQCSFEAQSHVVGDVFAAQPRLPGKVTNVLPEVVDVRSPGNAYNERDPQSSRLVQLERTVETLLQRVATLEQGAAQASHQQPDSYPVPSVRHQDGDATASDQHPAPLFVLRDAAADSGICVTDMTANNTPSHVSPDDPIMRRVLTYEEALALLSIFREHYSRWVSFKSIVPATELLEDLRRYPLLLVACCLIAVRHTSQDLASRLGPLFLKEAKALLSAAMLNTPQSIEYFQATLILSMWSTTISQVPLNTDSWVLSGFAIQHSNATDLFTIDKKRDVGITEPEFDRFSIWNHMCLVHLHYCVGTRRKAVLDRNDIERCRQILDSDQVSNFETRMVAEVFLYWIIYESCSTRVDLPRTQAALQSWKSEWKFLFDQPRSQFVQMGFYFAQLLTYDQSLKTRSAAAKESLLNEVIRLSTAIINFAMDTADDRTRHLTDHIYHMISFAAVTLSRLLHHHEEQLAASHDLHGLDSLVLSLVTWLHSIGLPCHVAHTMGDVVAAFHKKLRPNSGPSPSLSYADVDPAIHDDFAQLFPELFGETTTTLPEF